MSKPYKNKYFIVFYDKTGEHFINLFNNCREILKYRGLPDTRQNMNMLNVELYRALNSEFHFTKMLDGRNVVTVYIYDENEDEDDCDESDD